MILGKISQVQFFRVDDWAFGFWPFAFNWEWPPIAILKRLKRSNVCRATFLSFFVEYLQRFKDLCYFQENTVNKNWNSPLFRGIFGTYLLLGFLESFHAFQDCLLKKFTIQVKLAELDNWRIYWVIKYVSKHNNPLFENCRLSPREFFFFLDFMFFWEILWFF